MAQDQMAPQGGAFDAVLKRDRSVVIGALVLVALASWSYTIAGTGLSASALEMTRAAVMGKSIDMIMPLAWDPGYALLMVAMWWVMMIAMMLPSAAPMLLLFGVIHRRQRQAGQPYVPTALFAAGYLAAWGGFSVLAVGLQLSLERIALMSPLMQAEGAALGALILIAAGVYQLTPLKYACLRHCRSPLSFVMHHWRRGPGGAFRMGLEHGLFCLGCCWVLMTLLYYGGVMNLVWVAALALYVLIEKLAPAGHRIGRLAGVLLLAWGGLVMAGA